MKYLTVLTNIAYPIAGYFGNWYTFAAGMILMLGSGWMHYDRHEDSILADWMGMYCMSISTLAYLANPLLLVLIAPLPFFGNRIRSFLLIGMVTLIAVGVDQNLSSLLAFGLAFSIRQAGHKTQYHHITHAIWHLITALGFYFLLSGSQYLL